MGHSGRHIFHFHGKDEARGKDCYKNPESEDIEKTQETYCLQCGKMVAATHKCDPICRACDYDETPDESATTEVDDAKVLGHK
ncbi:hypothetical protein N7507_007793 [Penicillium longicatenatum]|nr:hypothetical protein N7507_007793 [Penicillium longicatenatum]